MFGKKWVFRVNRVFGGGGGGGVPLTKGSGLKRGVLSYARGKWPKTLRYGPHVFRQNVVYRGGVL